MKFYEYEILLLGACWGGWGMDSSRICCNSFPNREKLFVAYNFWMGGGSEARHDRSEVLLVFSSERSSCCWSVDLRIA